MKNIRTRYAPSPTGYLHIGGARTALFSYLFAKHLKGDFIIRIEDTDIERNVANGEASQLENLAWLGILPDESPINPGKYGPYRQSEKFDRYKKLAFDLIDKGLAYKAYDTSEELQLQKEESDKKGIASFRYDRHWLKLSEEEILKRDSKNEYAIRIICPENIDYYWQDIVRGEIKINSEDIGDWVILKSNGIATYNFAVVVDDHDMLTSHILRGEEHITNTPKQIMVYDAFGWEIPEFGHLTIITNMEGKKLSKRDTSLEQFIEDYKKIGYHPSAVFNFLALLGWTDASAREMLNHSELIENFDPNRLSKSPSKFDIEKMKWFSKQYWSKEDPEKIRKLLNFHDFDEQWINTFENIYYPSMITVKQMQNSIDDYLHPIVNESNLSDSNINVIKTFSKLISKSEFSVKNIMNVIEKTKEITGEKGKNLFMPIRIAMTGKEHGPELASSIYLMQEKNIFEIIKKLID
ncbi:glutamyl-tRNA synthetase [Mycoplasma testudineum]|uniref:Glutamate--tRNA ligase n=1 Tax=Mycoplasma testudineum TaxID=244584 RepID=A0A4R6IB43_9MOLU|nr:glutamate--tRNA ligase [Mycoplasma testudineum]OYD26588.1 glutamate--tRNA ligase [Mycoplasma testudineum]TDO19420.1 glutamyl-tRNA synthetase [Mycoplasma testudineum]